MKIESLARDGDELMLKLLRIRYGHAFCHYGKEIWAGKLSQMPLTERGSKPDVEGVGKRTKCVGLQSSVVGVFLLTAKGIVEEGIT